MNWSYIASILLLIVFFGGLLFIFVMAPDRVGKTNNGFGPGGIATVLRRATLSASSVP